MLCFFSACSSQNNDEYVVVAKASEIMEKVINRESFLLLITNDGCDPCEEFEALLKPVLAEKGQAIYQINYASIDQNMADQLHILLADYTSWPVLMYVKDGAVYSGNTYEYSLDPEGWKTWLLKQGIITQQD